MNDPQEAIAAPFVTSVMRVPAASIDECGRFKTAVYHALFSEALRRFNLVWGLTPDFIRSRNHSVFIAEVHVRYLAPLAEGDEVQSALQILDADSRRSHVFQVITRVRDRTVAGTHDSMALSTDLATRKVAPWPDDLAARLFAVRNAHAGLPVPDGAGQRIGMIRD